MRRLPYYIVCLWAVCVLIGCTGNVYTPALQAIDSLMNDNPDSALSMLKGMASEVPGWSKAQRMCYHLLTMKAQNKAYVDFTSDSLAKEVVEYYDNHGTANDRLLAHYLLGCVYRDLGESPHAVDCFQDAAACADTTATNCDFHTLSSVYSQMADQYRAQLLLSFEINGRKLASHYAALAKDTLHMIYELSLASGAYILINKVDSGETIQKQVVQLYNKFGFTQRALQASTVLMYLYVDDSEKISEAKELIDKYEKEYDLFDDDGNLPPTKRQFFYYKGRFYDQMNLLDSAEYYYRKVYHPQMLYSTKDAMYQGLLSVFQKRHIPDSIAKYAKLYCQVNDSSIAKKDQELTAKMASSYNYNRYQKQAADNAKRVSLAVIVIASLVLAFTAISIFVIVKWRKKKELYRKDLEEFNKLKKDYEVTMEQYHKNMHMLELLDNSHQTVIATIQRELEHSQEESDTYQKNYAKAQQEIAQISAQYENDKQKLTEENQRLSLKLELLEQKSLISKNLQVAKDFAETDIVKLIMVKERKPLSTLSGKDWKQLVNAVETYYPDILHDLSYLPKGSLQKTRTCLLVLLKISDSRIADWLDVKPTRVSNIKSELNQALFGDSSARSLYDNLKRKYSLILDV